MNFIYIYTIKYYNSKLFYKLKNNNKKSNKIIKKILVYNLKFNQELLVKQKLILIILNIMFLYEKQIINKKQ